ncbi:Uma2 family endonuclease [Streptomyces canus]|uniref:Uma2 family endonuclease n=1 Tax=Streptomyces canus TaxID=58343 RepID=A0AAW8FMN0_9ACTN|nr:Uma2 family endonuclease [Streptomyces canus]MDQ0760345.1 Uma2 family endonuclease [Streptomyces canus]MDQ0911007.1 Uma2 family endonuclease [Streptomyces canus]MDQ1071026.1 Uma2 family endonuclease [Streptomyces canus]
MTAMAHEPLTQEEVLLEGFLALDTPEGFRAELIEGEIVVTPPPDGDHEDYIELVVNQVYRRSGTDMQFSGNKGLKLQSGSDCLKDHVIPDGTFAPRKLRLYRGADSWMPCDGVAMVLEVTSTKPKADREAKRRCYARGGIPLYLLIDREASSVTLFSDPEKGDYREHCTRPFGKPLRLPEPFAFDMETADFL